MCQLFVIKLNEGADGVSITNRDQFAGVSRQVACSCSLTFSDAWADTHALYEEADVRAPVVSRDVAWLHRDGLKLPRFRGVFGGNVDYGSVLTTSIMAS